MLYTVTDIIIRIIISIPLIAISIKLFEYIVDNEIKRYIAPLYEEISKLKKGLSDINELLNRR